MAAQVPVAVGALVAGKYRVGPVLGAGGMGVVVSAWHEGLARRVALKFMHAQRGGRDGARRFLREAQAAARLDSEHVVRVLDVAELDDGTPYIVMERLDGCDLAALAARRRPNVAEAVALVVQACAGVAAAHAAGIVHRDLKPHNLFLARGAGGALTVKVLDFGVSKLVDPASPDTTGTDVVMGSPLYMAPEQMRSSRDVGPAADVWSLATILYELCAGAAPFAAGSAPEVYARVLGAAARPLADAAPQVPAALGAIVDRCLQADPAARLADAAAMREALAPHAAAQLAGLEDVVAAAAEATASVGATAGAALASTEASAPTGTGPAALAPTVGAGAPSPAPRSRRARILALAAGVGLVVAAAVIVLAPRGTAPPAARSAVEPRGSSLERTAGEVSLARGDWNGAITSFVACWELAADRACLRGHGLALLGLEQSRAGAAKLETYLAHDPYPPDRDEVIARIDEALIAVGPLPPDAPRLPEATGRAMAAFQRAQAAYNARDFVGSIPLWISAWEAEPFPQFLFNLGAAHEMRGAPALAAHFFERYLAWEPSPDDRDEVERRITRMRAASPPPAGAPAR